MSQTEDRYAKALFEIAQEQKNIEAVQNTMTDIRNIILKSEDFRAFLTNPLLTYEERCTVIKTLFQGKVPDILYRFLLFITYKSRLPILKSIIESFDSLYLLSTRQIRAYVKTAMLITEEDKAFINQRLNDKFQHNMITRWTLDPSLIGGFRIFAQDKIYDYSFKNQLSHFYQQTIQPS